MQSSVRAALLLAMMGIIPAAAGAQSATDYRLTVDNDFFDFRRPPRQRTDNEYTSGVRLTGGRERVIGWGRLAGGLANCESAGTLTRCGATTFEIGQLIFTPMIDAREPQPGARPYAGFLYGTMTARVERPRRLESAFATLGVTGPPSLASLVHRKYHGLLPRYRQPLGWDHEMPFEPAGAVGVAQSHLVSEVAVGRARLADVVASWDARIGTVRTSAGATVSVRAGYDIPHPWARADSGARALAAYAVASGHAEGVARDLFLGGSTFRRGQRVERTPFTGYTEWGFGVRLERLTVEYRLREQRRTYRTGPASHVIGIISANLRY